MKVLFLGFNPQNQKFLDVNREVNLIETELMKCKVRGLVVFKSFVNLTIEEFRVRLSNSEYDIIHFSCHGTYKDIIITDENLQYIYISISKLTDFLKTKKIKIKCIILNTCNSRDNAKALHQELDLDYAIGMNGYIPDQTAIKFSSAFYQALGDGESIKQSFDRAKDMITKNNILGCEIPSLIDIPTDYVTRGDEPTLRNAINNRNILIRVKGSKTTGKSRFIDHVTQGLEPDKYQIVSLYIPENIWETVHDTNQFLQWFCEDIARKSDRRYHWEQGNEDRYLANSRFTSQFIKYFLSSQDSRILILHLRNFDRIYDKPEIYKFVHNLFLQWVNESSSIWSGFRLILEYRNEVYTDSPSHLWSSAGETIILKYFNIEQVQSLWKQFDLQEGEKDHLIKLLNGLNGHPHLVDLALRHCRNISEKEQYDCLKNLATIAAIDELLSSHKKFLNNNSNFKKVFQDILSGSNSRNKDDPEVKQLLDRGLIIFDGNTVKPSCKFYTEYFTEYLKKTIPQDIPKNVILEPIKRSIKKLINRLSTQTSNRTAI